MLGDKDAVEIVLELGARCLFHQRYGPRFLNGHRGVHRRYLVVFAGLDGRPLQIEENDVGAVDRRAALPPGRTLGAALEPDRLGRRRFRQLLLPFPLRDDVSIIPTAAAGDEDGSDPDGDEEGKKEAV